MMSFFSTTIFLATLVMVLTACSSPARDVSAEGPVTPAVPAKQVSSEEIQLGEIRVIMTSDCRIAFTNRDSRKAQWSFPATGPCYFGKDRVGKVKVYQHVGKKKPVKPQLILAHSTMAVANGNCEGMNAGIMVNEGRVLVATPPFATYASCVGPKGGFDEKHYSSAWQTMLKDGKHEEVKFPTN